MAAERVVGGHGAVNDGHGASVLGAADPGTVETRGEMGVERPLPTRQPAAYLVIPRSSGYWPVESAQQVLAMWFG